MLKRLLRMAAVLMVAFPLAIALTAWRTGDAGAQSQGTAHQQNGNQLMIMDAGGKTHRVMRMNAITHAQKKAVAKRTKAQRKLAAQMHQGQSPKNEVVK